MTLTSRSQTTKRQTPDTKGEKRLALIGVGDLGCGCGGVLSIGIGIGDCDYPQGLSFLRQRTQQRGRLF
jgi:hypothetical protein